MKLQRITIMLCLIASTLSFTSCQGGQPVSSTPGVADSKKAVEGNKAPQGASVQADGIVYNASMSGEGHGVNKAFDKSAAPNDFWEAIGCPQWIKISYPQPMEIKGYELQTGEMPARMPREWQFQASDDDAKWIDLDTQADQKDWKVNEKRLYSIKKPGSHKFYRFSLNKGNDPEPMVLRIYEISLL
ncbi:MAG: discoidin domain-containing protein [Candidatus Magnetobacterium sp. LHC-1]|nr:discoidin domain-containing protein [Nitrospirota bacterium]